MNPKLLAKLIRLSDILFNIISITFFAVMFVEFPKEFVALGLVGVFAIKRQEGE